MYQIPSIHLWYIFWDQNLVFSTKMCSHGDMGEISFLWHHAVCNPTRHSRGMTCILTADLIRATSNAVFAPMLVICPPCWSVHCSQPPLFFNVKISNTGKSERTAWACRDGGKGGGRERKKRGVLFFSLPTSPPLLSRLAFCAYIQISHDPLCVGFNSDKKIEGCGQASLFKQVERHFRQFGHARISTPGPSCSKHG